MDDNSDNNTNKNSALNSSLWSDLSPYISTHSAHTNKALPPLDKWTPTTITPFPLTIQNNGDWWHDGTKMTRQSLINLFASVLWGEVADNDIQYYLKSPSDLYHINVADVPLFINDVQIVSDDTQVSWIYLHTTHGDRVRIDSEHSLYFGEFVPNNTHFGKDPNALYIKVRGNLHAKINRTVFYHLLNIGKLYADDTHTSLELMSGGHIHTLAVDNLS
ncbi:MAG: DUF1285 domain-containing protein [Moraxella sp.]|nr:DUF1285 domain-containing protein [Moraxella sp.]